MPAGYQHVAYDEKAVKNNPVLTLDEDYTIVPMGEEPKNWPYEGQYTERSGIVSFPKGANFYDDTKYVSLNVFFPTPLTLNVDTITVAGDLTKDDLEELKRAVHFFPMDVYTQFQSLTIDDFKITVVNGDGEYVIIEDKIFRNILASDWYTITVTGNVANGYTGTLYGTCFINRVAEEVDASVFKYEDYTTVGINGVMITGYTGTDKDVVIPDYIEGKKVLAIGDNAFKNNKDITSVTFGKYVRTVGFKAFAGCSALKSVEFNDDLQVISSYAFYLDKAITKIVFGNGLRTVRENAFSVDFIAGVAPADYAGQPYLRDGKATSEPSIKFVYGNYVDENGKAQYYAHDALAGRVYVFVEDVGALVGTPLDMFFGFVNIVPPSLEGLTFSNGVRNTAPQK